jgi:hypothetical protein
VIFFLIMLSAFLWGARKGYMQWKSQQPVFVQRRSGWRN